MYMLLIPLGCGARVTMCSCVACHYIIVYMCLWVYLYIDFRYEILLQISDQLLPTNDTLYTWFLVG